MIFNRINLMLPTYHRSQTKLPVFIDTALDTAVDPGNLRFTFCVNNEDRETVDFIKNRLDENVYDIIFAALEFPHLAQYFNAIYNHTRFIENTTLVSMFGDDFEFETEAWDEIVLSWAEQFNGIGIFTGNDRNNDNVATFFFTSRQFVDAQKPKPFMCEAFAMDGIDMVWTDVAKSLKRYYHIPNLNIFHNHAMRKDRMDNTWLRLRKQKKKIACNGNYEKECVATIKKNLSIEFESEIDVMMTTRDRLDLLRECVTSYCASTETPSYIHVFDDASDESKKVADICIKMGGCCFAPGERWLGSRRKNLSALRTMFDNFNSKAVLVIDSDAQLHRYWWQRANCLYRQLKDDSKFGCFSLFNYRGIEGRPCHFSKSLLEKDSVTGLGMLVTFQFWEKYIAPNEDGKGPWDVISSSSASHDNKFVCCSSPSYVQHLGFNEGTHVGASNDTCADDFEQETKFFSKFAVNENGKGILFSVMGRYGDVILGSFIANMLMEKGYRVVFLTTPYYRDLVAMVCPRAQKITTGAAPNSAWEFTDTKKMSETYPGYGYYINAQAGSPEHHSNCIFSGIPMYNFVKRIVEKAIGHNLPNDFLKYAELKRIPNVNLQYDRNKGLAVICPNAISTKSALTPQLIDRLYEKYNQEYDCRLLVEKRPEGISAREANEKYLYGYTFEQVIAILQEAKVFIGNDSGPAWASLFNPNCRKYIYHTRERLNQTNMWYYKLDSMAEDKVLEEKT